MSRRTGPAALPAGTPGAEAVLASTAAGTVSLLVGDGCDRLATVIRRLGGRVIWACAGAPPAAVTRAQDEPGDVLRVAIDPNRPLPFPDGVFDSVFVPRAPDPSSRVDGGGSRSKGGPHLEILRECSRVLRSGGWLVTSVVNRGGPGAVIRAYGRIARLTARWGVRLPAVPPPGCGYAASAWARLLEDGELQSVTRYLPWPRRDHWGVLVPAELRGRHPLPSELHWGPGRRGLLALVNRFGLQERVVAEYCAVAQRQTRAQGVGKTVVGQMTTPEAGSTGPVVLESRSDRTVTFVMGNRFFKLALRPIQAERYRWERHAIDRASDTGARRLLMPYVRAGSFGSAPFLVFPAAQVVDHSDEGSRVALLERVFDLLGRDAARAELRSTDAWLRITSQRSREEISRLGGSRLIERLLELGARRVPTGVVHGDLHPGNILERNRRPALVDWDRFEAASPLLLDRCNAANQLLVVRATGARARSPRILALQWLAERKRGTPLLHRIEEVSGDLSWPELFTFYVLSLASWAAIQGITGRSQATEERVREEIRIGLSCLSGMAPKSAESPG